MHGKLVSFILTGVSLSAAFADTVTLKTGKVYQGTFLSATRDRIVMQMDNKIRRRFNITDVRTVTFDRAPAQSLQGRSRTATTSPIDEKYRLFSGAQGMLGSATSQEQATADGRGRYRLYQKGAVYYTPQTGAHLTYGGIREEWTRLGAERSELGYPTSDEVATPDGGRVQYFEHGTITWNEREGASVEISTR
jgi:uncharacterized protein with LGFP repeats